MRIRDWSSDVCSSDLGTYGAKAVVNAPLTADVALRVAGQYSHSDGYARTIRTGEKLQGGERYSGRSHLQGEFGRPTALLSADYSCDHFSGARSEELCVGEELVFICKSRCSSYHYTKK